MDWTAAIISKPSKNSAAKDPRADLLPNMGPAGTRPPPLFVAGTSFRDKLLHGQQPGAPDRSLAATMPVDRSIKTRDPFRKAHPYQ